MNKEQQKSIGKYLTIINVSQMSTLGYTAYLDNDWLIFLFSLIGFILLFLIEYVIMNETFLEGELK